MISFFINTARVLCYLTLGGPGIVSPEIGREYGVTRCRMVCSVRQCQPRFVLERKEIVSLSKLWVFHLDLASHAKSIARLRRTTRIM